MYYVDIDLENKTSRPITTTISKGTVLEVKDLTSGVQCLVAERDVVVHLPPGTKRSADPCPLPQQ
jgi:hypothetical protein